MAGRAFRKRRGLFVFISRNSHHMTQTNRGAVMASDLCHKAILELLEPRQLLSANVTLNPAIVHQTIRGFGGDAARVVWAKDDAADDPTGQFLVNHLKPAIVRVGIPWKQWEPV